jgi:hypothetical protein
LLHNICSGRSDSGDSMDRHHMVRPEGRCIIQRSSLRRLSIFGAWDIETLFQVQQVRFWVWPPLFVPEYMYWSQKLQIVCSHRCLWFTRISIIHSNPVTQLNQLCVRLCSVAVCQGHSIGGFVDMAFMD